MKGTVRVSMMNVWIVCVSVHERLVVVPMSMRDEISDRRIAGTMRVLVVCIVDMRVIVRHGFVAMLMNVALRHV